MTDIQGQISEAIARIASLEAAAKVQGEWNREWRTQIINELEHLNDCINNVTMMMQAEGDTAREIVGEAVKHHYESCANSRASASAVGRAWQKWIQWIIMAAIAAIGIYIASKTK